MLVPGLVPEGIRVYAFGDVHGRLDLLESLRVIIARDLEKDRVSQPVIVGLGDYIDRGPDAAGVMEMLGAGLVEGVDHVLLRGNHEQLLLDFLDDPERFGPTWLQNGALTTLRSYDVSAQHWSSSRLNLSEIRNALAAHIPPHHLAMIRSMPLWHVVGDYLFVHAGVRSRLPLGRQSPDDLLWIRYDSVDQDDPFEHIVVHGHTPVNQPFVGRYRINIDTGAYASNRLTCLILQESSKKVIQT